LSVKLRSFAALGLVSLVLLVVGIVARPGLAQPVHGLAMHGDLKYAADFQHFDFADPDAPQGGTMRMATIGSFDSFNPFIIKGTSASGLTFWVRACCTTAC